MAIPFCGLWPRLSAACGSEQSQLRDAKNEGRRMTPSFLEPADRRESQGVFGKGSFSVLRTFGSIARTRPRKSATGSGRVRCQETG